MRAYSRTSGGAWRCWARALPGSPGAVRGRPSLRQTQAHRYTKDAPPRSGSSQAGAKVRGQQGGQGQQAGRTRRESKTHARRHGHGERAVRLPRRAPPVLRIIASEEDVREGVRALRRRCQTMRMVHDAAGDPPCGGGPQASRGWPESSSASSYRWRAPRRFGCAR